MSADSGPKSLPFSLERIHVLLSDIEQELASIPDKSSRVQALKAEIDALKQTLRSSASDSSQVAQQLRDTHNALDDLVASIEGEILRDTPYVAELGRILGLV
jgi:chaperonin cofactor prefoldin